MARTPAQRREYYQRNREKILAQQREAQKRYYESAKGKAAHQGHYERNRTEILVKRREYHQSNRDKRNAYSREYYQRNREKLLIQLREKNQRNRNEIRIRSMYHRHGIWPDQWAAMWDAQGGLCYLGGEPLDADSAVLDHDHSCCPRNKSCTACRRGLACGHCNAAIGLAGDDPDQLRRMADALEAAKTAARQRIAQKNVQLTLDEAG